MDAQSSTKTPPPKKTKKNRKKHWEPIHSHCTPLD
jgi:hypothetical protein